MRAIVRRGRERRARAPHGIGPPARATGGAASMVRRGGGPVAVCEHCGAMAAEACVATAGRVPAGMPCAAAAANGGADGRLSVGA